MHGLVASKYGGGCIGLLGVGFLRHPSSPHNYKYISANVLGTVKVLDGDGHELRYFGYMKEMITKVDNKKRVKETETIEGGFIALGFSRYITQYKIIEKNSTSSIIISTIEYELDDKLTNLTSVVNTELVETLAVTVGKYLTEKTPPPY
ncbi:uncharacterized protein LOC116109888 [Pistacia vera]|uniref:uncharacterized protein LOC116109888 n=1 Tax=Pistacia vera TaxID=55513 RepID=UPI0012635523|nr:uncharacterized protein LOC116109888 [Pistacia vera]